MKTGQRGLPAYADGGVVHPYSVRGVFNSAKKLFESAPPETMTQKYARQDAERAAKTPAPQVTPTEPKPDVVDTIRASNKLLQGLKDGGTVKAGIIRGPGTGTSDSIKGKMPVGSFVMPKDSTDVMVSNGETNFTPEMVQKIGAVALMAMKDATHTPVAEQTPSFKNGGAVKRLANGPDEEQQKQMGYTEQMRNVGNSFGDAASTFGGRLVDGAKTLVSAPGYGISNAMDEAAKTPAPPQSTTAIAPVAQAPRVTPGVSPTGGITTPAAPITPVQPAVAALAAPAAPNNQVTRVGNSYTGAPNISGDISINNPRGGGISAQNEQAAQALSDKYSAESRLANTAAPAGPQVFIGKDTGGFGILDKGYQQARSLKMDVDSSKRGNETTAGYNARISAAKDVYTGYQNERFATPRNDANRASQDAASQLSNNTSLANTRTNAETQRQGFGIQAQNNLATQQNAAARLGIDRTTAGLNNQATQQKISAGQQMQDLQNKLLTAKPEERAGLIANLQALDGKYPQAPQDKYSHYMNETQDGKTGVLYNERTGQTVGQQPAKAALPAKDKLIKGQTYATPRGQAVWNGSQFTPI